MDTKTGIIGAIVLVTLVVGLVVWYLSEHPAPFINTPTATSTQSTSSGAPIPVTMNESSKYYDIKASYPSSTSLRASASAAADARAVESMKDFEVRAVNAFKEQGNFDNLSSEDIQMMGFDQGRTESLEITYATKTGAHTVSYLYTIYEDTLGAHPNADFQTFTFDTKTGGAVQLNDLFSSSVDYLSVLSTITRAKLPAIIASKDQTGASQVDTSMINAGTAVDPANFKNWYIDGTNLVLVFPPYQVAPYAAGQQVVTIPFSQLGSSLSASYK